MNASTALPAGQLWAAPAQPEAAEWPNSLYQLAVVGQVDAADRDEVDEEFRPMLFGI